MHFKNKNETLDNFKVIKTYTHQIYIYLIFNLNDNFNDVNFLYMLRISTYIITYDHLKIFFLIFSNSFNSFSTLSNSPSRIKVGLGLYNFPNQLFFTG